MADFEKMSQDEGWFGDSIKLLEQEFIKKEANKELKEALIKSMLLKAEIITEISGVGFKSNLAITGDILGCVNFSPFPRQYTLSSHLDLKQQDKFLTRISSSL